MVELAVELLKLIKAQLRGRLPNPPHKRCPEIKLVGTRAPSTNPASYKLLSSRCRRLPNTLICRHQVRSASLLVLIR